MTIWIDKNEIENRVSQCFNVDNDKIEMEKKDMEDRVKYKAILNATKVNFGLYEVYDLKEFVSSIRTGNPEIEISNDSLQDFVQISFEVDKNVCRES